MLHSLQSSFYKEVFLKKFISPEHLQETALSLKKQGKTLVTLNGSFDLLHAGHLEMIYQASKQGDVLFVALNTDRSIQEYKSKHRPIIPLEERMQMIAALQMVAFVTYFDEIDPRAILAKIAPDIHVNGSEYGENCIEAPVVQSLGGTVHVVSLIPGLSTSQILAKIREIPA